MRNCSICNDNNTTVIYKIKLSLIKDNPLNDTLNIKKCNNCNFYYSDSNNTQSDYDNYYKLFNNYKHYSNYSDKDERCSNYLKHILKDNHIKTILDYGSGNGLLKNLLSDMFMVNEYDIGMIEDTKQYDCLILSHVLEHIYNIDEFMYKIKLNIKTDGILYIEVPNADFYEKITEITPLQEINIEHINYFSKLTLNKLLLKHGFQVISIIDDFFKIKENNYYVIRGIFKKCDNNMSFENYLHQGISKINSYNFEKLNKYSNIYVYGAGQFLFKILDRIMTHTTILNIIDDNNSLLNKSINNISIINFEKYSEICKDNDTILITTMIYDNYIKDKFKLLDKNINYLTMYDM
jgi:hypothetical protein